MKNKIVSEGFSMNYLIPAMIALVGGVVCIAFAPMITIFALPLAAFLLLFKTGIEINFNEKKIRSYNAILGLRIGLWTKYEENNTISLRYQRSAAQLMSRGSNTTVRAETYDCYLIKGKDKEIRIHEFTNYPTARKLLRILKEQTQLKIEDEYRDIQMQAIARRHA